MLDQFQQGSYPAGIASFRAKQLGTSKPSMKTLACLQPSGNSDMARGMPSGQSDDECVAMAGGNAAAACRACGRSKAAGADIAKQWLCEPAHQGEGGGVRMHAMPAVQRLAQAWDGDSVKRSAAWMALHPGFERLLVSCSFLHICICAFTNYQPVGCSSCYDCLPDAHVI